MSDAIHEGEPKSPQDRVDLIMADLTSAATAARLTGRDALARLIDVLPTTDGTEGDSSARRDLTIIEDTSRIRGETTATYAFLKAMLGRGLDVETALEIFEDADTVRRDIKPDRSTT